MSHLEIGQVVAGIAGCASAAERPLAVRLLVRRLIELFLSAIEAEGDLVFAPGHLVIVRELEVIYVEIPRGAGAAGNVEVIADGDLNVIIRHVVVDLHAERLGSE